MNIFYERFSRHLKPTRKCFLKVFQHFTSFFLGNFQPGLNTLFYMLPCLLHLIIFSLFRYRQEANAWMDGEVYCIFHSCCFFSLVTLRDKRKEECLICSRCCAWMRNCIFSKLVKIHSNWTLWNDVERKTLKCNKRDVFHNTKLQSEKKKSIFFHFPLQRARVSLCSNMWARSLLKTGSRRSSAS